MQEMKMMNNGFSNGCARSNTGQRQILFSSTGELRPVAFSVESGYAPDRGTVQVSPRAGDLIARVDWDRRGKEYSLSRATEDGDAYGQPLPLNAQAPVWAMLKSLHPWMDGWLAPTGRGPSYLPAEVFGETLAARAKRERCEAAFRRFGLPLAYSQEWAISPKAGINTRAAPLNFAPGEYQATARSWSGSVVGIDRRERFFSSAGNGTPAVELFPVLDEEHGSNYAHERTEYRSGQPGIPGWNRRRYLIRLVTGPIPVNTIPTASCWTCGTLKLPSPWRHNRRDEDDDRAGFYFSARADRRAGRAGRRAGVHSAFHWRR